jgi:hypothetical protein
MWSDFCKALVISSTLLLAGHVLAIVDGRKKLAPLHISKWKIALSIARSRGFRPLQGNGNVQLVLNKNDSSKILRSEYNDGITWCAGHLKLSSNFWALKSKLEAHCCTTWDKKPAQNWAPNSFNLLVFFKNFDHFGEQNWSGVPFGSRQHTYSWLVLQFFRFRCLLVPS